jgi:drug/metabolite transporter (DMT)-like permease
MEPLVLILVLAAAVLHASWNALVKSGGDPWVRLAIANVACTVVALMLLPFVGVPAPAAWPFILGSVTIHQVYFVFVALQYRVGDLSYVYPISRGAAPLLVAAAAYVVAGETLSLAGTLAVMLICGAILSLTFGRRGTWMVGDRRSTLFALCTSVTIAAYTLVDGLGGRTTENVIDYIVYLFLVDSLPFALLVVFLRRRALVPTIRNHWRTGVLGGLLAFLAYGLVIWAMTLSPMTYVSALRETSVILAALIGMRVLKEPFGARRIAAACCVAAGVILLQFSQG